MNKLTTFTRMGLVAVALSWAAGPARAQSVVGPVPGTTIDYTLANYANSPLPTLTGSLTGVRVTDGGAGYILPPTVTIDPPPAGGTAPVVGPVTLGPNGVITAITLTGFGSGYLTAPNVTIAPAAEASFVTGVILGTLRNDYGGFLGIGITVGTSPITVTRLGRMMATGNTGTHTVKLVNASTGLDVPGGSVVVNMIGGAVGQFQYASLGSPVTLAANTRYYLLSQEVQSGDSWYNCWSTYVTTTGAAVEDTVVWGAAPGWATLALLDRPFVPLDFKYTGGAAAGSVACGATAVAVMGVTPATGMRKFVDSLPGLTAAGLPVSGFYSPGPTGVNDLGQAIPVAISDTATFPGSDYYQIALVDYREQMHKNLPATGTLLRGYVQIYTPGAANPGGTSVALTHPNGTPLLVSVNGTPTQVYGYAKPSYLGPVIVATRGTATRIKFYNLLPAGSTGNLFLPVDTTIMGAGAGGWAQNASGVDTYTAGIYPQNRATLHLHGGLTPWISDGTPHQWTVPLGDITTPYQKGAVSTTVPDMTDGQGVMTFYYPNQQSGRLMFYHDHAYGITRLNVYGGEAAGYLLVDAAEEGTLGLGAITQVPLVIQDRTFVWGAAGAPGTGTYATDPSWATVVPTAQPGDLWLPHVYMPNQNPADFMTGANPLGRWDYGPWFWPPQLPTGGLLPMPVISTVPEMFMDTPVVNGTAYPYMSVAPQMYRFRILNACNDRMVNLQLYQADPTDYAIDSTGAPVTPSATSFGTEVKMVTAALDPAIPFPPVWRTQTPGMVPEILDNRPGGVPDPTLRGPAIVQIGTEGGILPAPAVLNNTPVGYEQNKRNIVVLNVSKRTLFMGPAERADILIDFTAYAGKTVILYNDSPAPVPAGDPRIDYYSGNGDYSTSSVGNNQGGAPSTLPGYGPNTRTIMQFRVSGTPLATPPVGDEVPANLVTISQAVVNAFVARNEPPIAPEATYPVGTPGYSYGTNYSRIQDTVLSITANDGSTMSIPMQPKALHELFDEYGRMNSVLGVELPFTSFLIQTTIPYKYIDPVTETIPAGQTQVWKLTHNGVDTHAIHFHLVNVQVINRVGWDGAIQLPDANELGWKETVRMNPLQDVIVAATARVPALPFPIPTSSRPLDVTMPTNTTAQFTGINPADGTPLAVTNNITDFGWEYVWHCHLLGHEENDMMRPLVMTGAANYYPSATATVAPAPNAAGWNTNNPTVTINATDYAGGAGIASITYTVNGGAPTTVAVTSVAIPISTDGTNIITFFATDTLGLNTFPKPQTLTVKLDKTAPVFVRVPTVTPSAVANGSTPNPRNVTVSGTAGAVTDATPGSGLDNSINAGSYTITDNKTAAVLTGTFTLNANGSYSFTRALSTTNSGTQKAYTITITVKDKAGNIKTSTGTFTVG